MIVLDLNRSLFTGKALSTSVLMEHDQMKIRRIELAKGAQIPECQMQEDLVFVLLSGRVTFRSEEDEKLLAAPGAVFIQGGATTRSMEAHEESLILAVLCHSKSITGP